MWYPVYIGRLFVLRKFCSVRMDLYPKSCIDVFVTVLEEGGGTLSAAITATGAACYQDMSIEHGE